MANGSESQVTSPRVLGKIAPKEKVKEPKQQKLKFRARSTVQLEGKLAEYDALIDDEAIDEVLGYETNRTGRTPYRPSQLIRVHIVKSVEDVSSFNKVCKKLRSSEGKHLRKFCGFKNMKKTPAPATLTNFRQSLTFWDCIRLIMVFLNMAFGMELFSKSKFYAVDSSDLESPCNWTPVEVIKDEDGNKIEVFSDIEARKGVRRGPKDSKYFVGCRKHSFGVYLPDSNKVINLVSLVVPANRHDVDLLMPLIRLANLIGLKVEYVVCDAGYVGKKKKEHAFDYYGATISTPKKDNTKLPEDVTKKGEVLCPKANEKMSWAGFDAEKKEHTYVCGLTNPKDCFFYSACNQERTIPIQDNEVAFGPIPVATLLNKYLQSQRKLHETSWHRNKENGGLKNITLKGKKNVQFLATIANICDLLDEIIAHHKRRYRKTA